MVLMERLLVSVLDELSARLDHDQIFVPGAPPPGDALINSVKYHLREGRDDNDAISDPAVWDLSRGRLPNFLREVHGFSFSESFGRWTDNDVARLIFTKTLPEYFEISLEMRPHCWNRHQPIIVAAGGHARAVVTHSDKLRKYRIRLACKYPTRAIEIFIPNAISPYHFTRGADSDTRRLGLGIQRIGIKPLDQIFFRHFLRWLAPRYVSN